MPHKRAKRSIREAEVSKKGFNLAPSSSTLKDDTPRNASRILNSAYTQARFRDAGRRGNEDTGERRSSKTARAGGSSSAGGAEKVGNNANEKGKQKANGAAALPSIEPHESLGAYNRRLAEFMRPSMSKALKNAQAIKMDEREREKAAKKERIRKAQGKAPLDPPLGDGEEGGTMAGGVGKGKRKRSGGDNDFQFEDRPVVTLETAAPRRRLNDVAMAPPSLPQLKGGGGQATSKKRKAGEAGSSSRLPVNAGQARLLEVERQRVIKEYRDMKARKGAT